jgi:hypothetical protein
MLILIHHLHEGELVCAAVTRPALGNGVLQSRQSERDHVLPASHLTPMRFVLKPMTEARYFLAPW